MPNLGEVKKAYEVGLKSRYLVVWIACPKCGTERWVQNTMAKRNRLCPHCTRRTGRPRPANPKGLLVRGYRIVRIDANDFFYSMTQRVSKGWVLEHRLIMAKHLGRCLQPWEIVHHRDGNKLNNDISNLSLVTDAGHNQITHFEKIVNSQQKEIAILQSRVTILEAENILLKSVLDIEPTKSMS